jgi:hypothetical protein
MVKMVEIDSIGQKAQKTKPVKCNIAGTTKRNAD